MQLLVDAIQDIKERMDFMFERREWTPQKKDGSREDFHEDPDKGKRDTKILPEARGLNLMVKNYSA